MSRRLNINSRRVSKEFGTNKMFLKQFHGNHGSTFSKERNSQPVHDIAQNNLFNKGSTDISKSPYTNLAPTTSTGGYLSEGAQGSLLQKYSSPTSVGSPLHFNSPRNSLIRSAAGSRI